MKSPLRQPQRQKRLEKVAHAKARPEIALPPREGNPVARAHRVTLEKGPPAPVRKAGPSRGDQNNLLSRPDPREIYVKRPRR